LFEDGIITRIISRISKSKRIIDITGKNFIKLVKNENSPYICKQLKKEALGRICTIIQKINKSLIFLEKIRKHLDKLPELDPHRKTVILSGPSKVGKSSFLNKTTRANTKVGSFNKSGHFRITSFLVFLGYYIQGFFPASFHMP
jgi:nucleolar GTP-binding protein